MIEIMNGFLFELFLLVAALAVLGKTSSWAVRSSVSLSHVLGIPKLVVSFLVVTAISVLPETVISILSALRGVPSLGLGTLLGSNVADLTFVFGIVALLSRKPLKVESNFISKDYLFLAFLLLPLILGFTGHYSRFDGVILIVSSILFGLVMLETARRTHEKKLTVPNHMSLARAAAVLALSLVFMGTAAHIVVTQGELVATRLFLSPALIGLLVVALGTTLPELLFSVRAVRQSQASLALGDIMGTVIVDATFVLGITAVISPFSFNPRLIIVTGTFMLLAGLFSLGLLRSGKELTKQEGMLLLVFYALFIMIEFSLRNWTPLYPLWSL